VIRRRTVLASLTAGGALLTLPVRSQGGVRAGVPITLPRDFGAHPEFRTEWWYVTGEFVPASLQTPPDPEAATEPYGFQITFFRSRTDVAQDHPSAFAARQLVFAHAALTDPASRKLRHDQRIARAGFGIAQASALDTDVQLRGWSLRREGPIGSHRYLARIDAAAQGFGFDLQLAATQPVLLQGDAGYSRKGPDPAQASYYLSEPQLALTGTLTLAGRPVAVAGRAWLDHEWSDALLHPDAVGWDWIGMNLDDGGALTAFRLRRKDGSALWAGGSLRSADGRLRVFGPSEVAFEPLRTWVSPATQARYPVQWRVTTPVGAFEVRARLDAQELDSRASTGTVYWEGLSDLYDAQGQRVGRGYLELTGYASPLRLG
jgi:predicted secreted hydrolase